MYEAIQKVCHHKNPDFWSPSPLVTVCHCLPWTPSPLVTTQIVTNFELITSLPLMRILDLIFAKMCIFSTQTLLSKRKATLKSSWGDVITTFKVIIMLLLKRYFFEVVTSLFCLTPSPLVTHCNFLLDPPPPLSRWQTFWIAPNVKSGNQSLFSLNVVD